TDLETSAAQLRRQAVRRQRGRSPHRRTTLPGAPGAGYRCGRTRRECRLPSAPPATGARGATEGADYPARHRPPVRADLPRAPATQGAITTGACAKPPRVPTTACRRSSPGESFDTTIPPAAHRLD